MEWKRHWPTILFLALAVLARLIFPADVPFINDEPHFLNFGLQFSQTFDPLVLGLPGKFGVRYGPYTSWFFGLLFLISKNLVIFAFLKILLVTAMVLVACLWLVRELPFVKLTYTIPVLAGVYLFMDARLLWDLNIPNTILALAAYVGFLKRGQFWMLLLSVVMLSFATLTHLMSLPLVFAIVIHFFLFQWDWIKSNLGKIAVLTFVVLLLNGPYYWYVLNAPKASGVANYDHRALLYALMGGRLFSTHDFSYFLGDDWWKWSGMPDFLNIVTALVAGLTWIAYPISWTGITIMIRKTSKLSWAKFKTFTLEDQVLLIGLTTILFHAVFSFMGDLRGHPHYYNGAWTGILLLFWFGLSTLEQKWPALFKLQWGYYGILLFFLWKTVLFIHMNNGTRSLHYGPTLGNQIEVVEKILATDGLKQLEPIALHPRAFPHAFQFIAGLIPTEKRQKNNTAERGRVDYVSQDPLNGQIALLLE